MSAWRGFRAQDLDEILTAIEQGDNNSGLVIYGLKGMGGLGKSVLAFKIAQEVADRYPDGQLFLDLQGTEKNPPKPEELMAEVIRSLDPEARVPNDPRHISAEYRSMLQGKRNPGT